MLLRQHIRSFIAIVICAAICMACGTTYDVEAWSLFRARHINLRTGDTLVADNTSVRASDYGIQMLFTKAPLLSISSGSPSASRKSLLNNVVQRVYISANRPVGDKEPGADLSKLFLANVANDGFLITLDSFVRRPPMPITEQLTLKLNTSIGRRDTVTFRIDLTILPQRQLSVTLPPVVIE
jgi:hypothetical protein